MLLTDEKEQVYLTALDCWQQGEQRSGPPPAQLYAAVGAAVILAGDAPTAGSWAGERLRALALGQSVDMPQPEQRGTEQTGAPCYTAYRLLCASQKTLLIAADAGGDALVDLGLTPDYIVGDGDSSKLSWPGVQRISYPAAKNFTDGEAALELALKHTEHHVEVYGALGGRLDHLLANVLLPLAQGQNGYRVHFVHDNMEAALCRHRCHIWGQPGDIMSFIPLSSQVTGVFLPEAEFEYPLSDFQAPLGSSRMVSNVLRGHEAVMTMKEGLVLAIHYHGEKSLSPA